MPIRIGPIVRNVLAVWGALSLLLLAVVVIASAYHFTIGVKPRDGRATKDDVRFVLNWPQLGDGRIDAVVQSHESSVHFSGDHFTAYAIRVTTLSETELTSGGRWVRGDHADPLMVEAIRFVTEARHEAAWLPTAEEFLDEPVLRLALACGGHGESECGITDLCPAVGPDDLLRQPAGLSAIYVDALIGTGGRNSVFRGWGL